MRYVCTACLLHPFPPLTNPDVEFTKAVKCSVNVARVFRNGVRQRLYYEHGGPLAVLDVIVSYSL